MDNTILTADENWAIHIALDIVRIRDANREYYRILRKAPMI